jgi:Zn-dependent metalloprotease
MRLDSTVHFREDPSEPFDNAFWNGSQMIYGDGDGKSFQRFTKCLDVIGHELTHGITQYEAGLAYHGQSGALNESFSDVFGSLVKQWSKKQTAAQADWLIGAGLLGKGVNGIALRSLKKPGSAYDDPLFGGKDPQPGHMKHYVKLADTRAGDNGGVHINSGIPNHAFYLAASALGGHAWEKAGRIWYDALAKRLQPTSGFQDAAKAMLASAGVLFGAGGTEEEAVRAAWQGVGVLT